LLKTLVLFPLFEQAFFISLGINKDMRLWFLCYQSAITWAIELLYLAFEYRQGVNLFLQRSFEGLDLSTDFLNLLNAVISFCHHYKPPLIIAIF